jgi:hypothetical protein
LQHPFVFVGGSKKTGVEAKGLKLQLSSLQSGFLSQSGTV